MRLFKCEECGKEKVYFAKNLCESCYKKIKRYSKKWANKNRDYWKKYYYRNREKLIKRQAKWNKKQDPHKIYLRNKKYVISWRKRNRKKYLDYMRVYSEKRRKNEKK